MSLVGSWSDSEGRLLQCEFQLCGVRFRIISLYAPNRNPQQNAFLDSAHTYVDPSVPTIFAGDFNSVFDRAVDRRGSCVDDNPRESSVALDRLFTNCCCVDVWRYLFPSQPGFTWTRNDGVLSSRIDLIGCPTVWAPFISFCDILPCPFSDHCGLRFSISVPDVVSPGPGLWKFNISILEEDDNCQLIREFWADWKYRRPSFPTVMDWWEMGKSKVKGITIAFCKELVAKRRRIRGLLSNLAQHLKAKVDNGVISCIGPYQNTLSEIAHIDREAAKGTQIRVRVQWVEERETSSAFFFRRSKNQMADRWVSALRGSDGVVFSDIDGIRRVLSSFYSSLFSAEDVDLTAQDFLLGNLVSSLSPQQAETCEGPLTVAQCHRALLGMARRKAPGSDGLSAEFYIRFWEVLGADLVDVFNFCFSAGFLTKSQRRGVISLTFKKGDRLDPGNSRPVSLLNVDYKIASKAIAGRLSKVIHLVVNCDQSCGVPGRFIGDTVALLRDVVNYAASANVPVAILSLNQEKAFDRVDWGFLRSTLVHMGFGPSFVGWVDLFYSGVQSAVKVNGYLTHFFGLSRGVRQGCPLSPLLYVLYAEVLACSFRANPRIRGLLLPGASSPLSVVSQYADDTSLVVSTTDAIKAVFDTYAVFASGSGSRLNQVKSKGLWLGSWYDRVDAPVRLDWTSGTLKVLGVFIGSGNVDELNWRPRIVAVKNVLNSWRQRGLSFRGKALIVNALALARIWYVAGLIHLPAWALRELSS